MFTKSMKYAYKNAGWKGIYSDHYRVTACEWWDSCCPTQESAVYIESI